MKLIASVERVSSILCYRLESRGIERTATEQLHCSRLEGSALPTLEAPGLLT